MIPKRILLSNIAHVGDVILGTSMLPVLKSAFKGIEIGFLVGENGARVLKDHKLVDYIHIFNHPRLIRKEISNKEKRKEGSKTYQEAIIEIKALEYDIAIDQYSIFAPCSKSLLFNAEIPCRIGWSSYQNPYYFNHLINYPDPSWHIVKRYEEALKHCQIEEKHLKLLKPSLVYKDISFNDSLLDGYKNKKFIVVHMGTGDIKREWIDQEWVILCKKLQEYGCPLVFTGSGGREKKRINYVRSHLKKSLDLCDQICIKNLLELVRRSQLVIGLESMIVHLASAIDIPVVAVYGGHFRIERWRPFHENSYLLTPPKQYFNEFSTAPMSAINLIRADEVLTKVLEVLSL